MTVTSDNGHYLLGPRRREGLAVNVKFSPGSGHAITPICIPQASTRRDVSITQHVSLKLQVVQTVLDYITDLDDTGELAIA